jgi:hypothetical protein
LAVLGAGVALSERPQRQTRVNRLGAEALQGFGHLQGMGPLVRLMAECATELQPEFDDLARFELLKLPLFQKSKVPVMQTFVQRCWIHTQLADMAATALSRKWTTAEALARLGLALNGVGKASASRARELAAKVRRDKRIQTLMAEEVAGLQLSLIVHPEQNPAVCSTIKETPLLLAKLWESAGAFQTEYLRHANKATGACLEDKLSHLQAYFEIGDVQPGFFESDDRLTRWSKVAACFFNAQLGAYMKVKPLAKGMPMGVYRELHSEAVFDTCTVSRFKEFVASLRTIKCDFLVCPKEPLSEDIIAELVMVMAIAPDPK